MPELITVVCEDVKRHIYKNGQYQRTEIRDYDLSSKAALQSRQARNEKIVNHLRKLIKGTK